MIEERTTVIYYSSNANRRYLTKAAAIKAEARALIKERYPTEDSEYDDQFRVTHPGWHWRQLENSDKFYRRVCRLIKSNMRAA